MSKTIRTNHDLYLVGDLDSPTILRCCNAIVRLFRQIEIQLFVLIRIYKPKSKGSLFNHSLHLRAARLPGL